MKSSIIFKHGNLRDEKPSFTITTSRPRNDQNTIIKKLETTPRTPSWVQAVFKPGRKLWDAISEAAARNEAVVWRQI